MSNYFKAVNSDGIVLINDKYKAIELKRTLTVNDLDVYWDSKYFGYLYVQLQDDEVFAGIEVSTTKPTLQVTGVDSTFKRCDFQYIEPPYNLTDYHTKNGRKNVGGFYINGKRWIVEGYSGDTDNGLLYMGQSEIKKNYGNRKIYTFGYSTSNDARSKYGLQLFDKNGDMLFDSNCKYANVVNFKVNDGGVDFIYDLNYTDANFLKDGFALQGGRTYALVELTYDSTYGEGSQGAASYQGVRAAVKDGHTGALGVDEFDPGQQDDGQGIDTEWSTGAPLCYMLLDVTNL